MGLDAGYGIGSVKPGVCTSSTRPASPYNGQVIYMTDVDQTAVWDGTAWTVLAPIAGGRNVIINGGFDIWQRGTTITNPVNSYTADRWVSNSGENQTYTRQTSGAPSGSRYYARLTATQASCFFVPNQFIETNNTSTLWGKTAVASLLIRRNATMNTAITFSLDKTSTVDGGISASWTTIGSVVIANADMPTGTGTTDWYKATLTCSVPNDGTANTLRIRLLSGSSANNSTVDISQVQLEAGAVATPFEFEDYGTTLAKCQRYYIRFTSVGSNGVYSIFGVGQGDTTTNVETFIPFPVVMRTPPTSVETTATASNYSIYGGTVLSACTVLPVWNASNSNVYNSALSFRSTGAVIVGRAYQILAYANNVAYLGFSAEL